MSGLNEIIQWVKDNKSSLNLSQFDNVDEAYNRINDPKKEDWRNDLDDILLDQKSKFLDFLDTQISQPQELEPEDEPEDLVKVKGFSFVNFKGTIVNVGSFFRRKVKR